MERRDALKVLFGAGGVGLAALATGLPTSFLLRPLASAGAQDECAATKAQYLVMSVSGAGDPLNANAPGSYAFDDIVHAVDPAMAKTNMLLGSNQVTGAQIWSTLPQWVLDRSAFIHHSTLTNNHPNMPKVMRLMGATMRSEMVGSIAAAHLGQCFKTVQQAPVSAGAGTGFTFEGRALPDLRPTALRDLLAKDMTPLGNLQALRDSATDQIHEVLKANGTRAQLAYLDNLVQSRAEARSIGDDLLSLLSLIVSDREDGQILAAVALIKMNVAPVVMVKFNFGGDNHSDDQLMAKEVPQTVAGVGYVAGLMQALKDNALEDKVTFGMMNVFGRTLKKKGLVGRDHWGGHHVSVLIGKNVKGGVIGGLVPTPKNDDYVASGIDSVSGRSTESGDVTAAETLASTGKTFNAALGVPDSVIDATITQGKVLKAALV